nr:MAG: RNA-dependent RNA polymerase [Moss associated botourmia-like virus 18]
MFKDRRMIPDQARSRVANVTSRPVDNSASGSTVKRCSQCAQHTRLTKETIHNGLLLLRVRYGLPYSELPDCDPSNLGRFLSFLLLQGKERASVVFPRRQRFGEDGLCTLQRLCRAERWELAQGCSSIKRNLPSGCSRHTPSVRKQWEASACSPPTPNSPGYLDFVRGTVSRLFPSGWDWNYDSYVWNHLPNPTARAKPRSVADRLWRGRRGEFVSVCRDESDLSTDFTARYKEVQSAGKKRPLLIFSEEIDMLAPMHKLLYARLCKTDWLLCGPPTNERITSTCVNPRQTSVDLVAATDGLSHEVSNTILDALFFTSVSIPRSMRRLAYKSLRPLFQDEDGIWKRVTHGQMMGSYLSFPLLCIHSYCAASWAARDDETARFLVNGDDCVISSRRDITMQDYPLGYRLNDDKTIRAGNVVEVNSTTFLKRGNKWREVRHLRRGGAPVDFQGMLHMAKACTVTPAFTNAFQRARIGRRWGFLPSQLGHWTYPAYSREQGFHRAYTQLPEPECEKDERLIRYSGVPNAIETEALRSFLWEHGRKEGLKRDVFSPSCGKVRRTYVYKTCRYRFSFVGWADRGKLSQKKPDIYFLPEEYVSEEEMRGLCDLEKWSTLFGDDGLLLEGRAGT